MNKSLLLFATLLLGLLSSAHAQTVSLCSGSTNCITVPSGSSITVSAATVTPPPVVQPPTASISATPTTITAGGSTTISWTTSGATTVTLNGATVAASGSETVSPTVTTEYDLDATDAVGTTTEAAQVTVNPAVVATCNGNSVTSSGVINGNGGTYCLTANITGSVQLQGSGTFDFNGHTITFNTGAAIMECSQSLAKGPTIYLTGAACPITSNPSGTWTITNSAGNSVPAIVQAANGTPGIPAVYFGTENSWGSVPAPTISNLRITVNAAASQGIRLNYVIGAAKIENNVIDATAETSIQIGSQTPEMARYAFQGYQIWVGGNTGATGTPDTISGNQLIMVPQGGIVDYMTGSAISHNTCTGNSHYSNDYCVESDPDNQQITHNNASGQMRGYDAVGNGWLLDHNTANVYETNTNTEYSGCEDGGGYGIRVKFNPQDNTAPPQGTVSNNTITVTAKLCTAEAFDTTDLTSASQITLTGNSFTSVAGPGGLDAAMSADGSAGILIGTGNTLTGSYGFYSQWDGIDMTVPAGQVWNVKTALVNENDGGTQAAWTLPMSLMIADKPVNTTVVCGTYSTATVVVGGKSTACN